MRAFIETSWCGSEPTPWRGTRARVFIARVRSGEETLMAQAPKWWIERLAGFDESSFAQPG
ncbi:MAG: hypothetical protein JRG83_18620 [Deltaproteobacteria bacterium]|nr:hypothetical protein [Deltaproteobacteria bacterium]